jgi:hypothetical protein
MVHLPKVENARFGLGLITYNNFKRRQFVAIPANTFVGLIRAIKLVTPAQHTSKSRHGFVHHFPSQSGQM